MWGRARYASNRARGGFQNLARFLLGSGAERHGPAPNTATRSRPDGVPNITTLIEARHNRQAGNTSRAVMTERVKRHAILSKGVCSNGS